MNSSRSTPQTTFDLYDIISAFADMSSCMAEIAVPRHPDTPDPDDLFTDHQLLVLYNSLASSHSMRASFSEAIAELGKSINWSATSDHCPFEIAARRHYTPVASLQFHDLVDPELLERASLLKTEVEPLNWSHHLGLVSQADDPDKQPPAIQTSVLERAQ